MKGNITQICLFFIFHIFCVCSTRKFDSIISRNHNISSLVLNKNKGYKNSCINESQTICLTSTKCKHLDAFKDQEEKICPSIALQGRLINFTAIDIQLIDTITVILRGSNGYINMWGNEKYSRNQLIFSSKLDKGYHT